MSHKVLRLRKPVCISEAAAKPMLKRSEEHASEAGPLAVFQGLLFVQSLAMELFPTRSICDLSAFFKPATWR